MDEITITKIEIRNFRSISKLIIDTKNVSIFVGQNDAGKSNILRALNLFFNNETDPGYDLDFQTDFYIRGTRARKADEISVEIELTLPNNYVETNGDVLVWKRIWRKESKLPVYDEYFGRRIKKGTRGGNNVEEIKIPSRSNLHSTLKQINYIYVPATKTTNYFDSLRGQIYHTISNVAQESFHKSSKDFEGNISKHLLDLTNGLASSLGFDSKLSLPADLSPIFEKLDFISSEKISLKNRGDGIKARYIPHILYFMAQKQKELGKRGGPRYTTIWGYEEPENNLEMMSCSLLAQEIFNYNKSGIAQIFLTTHSPIFYNVGKENQEASSIHFVYQDDSKEQTLCSNTIDNYILDSKMGVTPIYAEKIMGIQRELDALRVEANENKKIFEALQRKATCSGIFVEGESDKLVINKALKIFKPEFSQKVFVETKISGAGHSYVIDMLSHWRSRHKHHITEPKAAGIVDEDASKERTEWNKVPDNTSSAKCFVLPKTQEFISVDRAVFKVSLSLETLYPISIWQYAKNQGWLEEIDKKDYFHSAIVDQLIEQTKKPSDYISEVTPLFITHKFKKDKKINAATYVCKQSDEFFKDNFGVLNKFLDEVKTYLGYTDT